jgi:hypothetical protein
MTVQSQEYIGMFVTFLNDFTGLAFQGQYFWAVGCVCKRFYKLQDMEGTIYKPEYVLKGV